MVQELSISERRACRYTGLSRTSYQEPPGMNESTANPSTRIVELAHERRRFGYRRTHDLLALEGRKVNHKRVWRLYKLATTCRCANAARSSVLRASVSAGGN